jgi:hypothetical protein
MGGLRGCTPQETSIYYHCCIIMPEVRLNDSLFFSKLVLNMTNVMNGLPERKICRDDEPHMRFMKYFTPPREHCDSRVKRR